MLQALFMTPELRKAMYRWRHDEARADGGAVPPKEECIPYQLQKLFVRMQTSADNAVDTEDLRKSFGWSTADAIVQQDCEEFIIKLLDTVCVHVCVHVCLSVCVCACSVGGLCACVVCMPARARARVWWAGVVRARRRACVRP